MNKINNKKTKTIQTYSSITKKLGEGYDEYFKNIVQPEADSFLTKILKGGKILDAGCGIGTHSLYFEEKGYNVISVDLSQSTISSCQKKGLNAFVMDLENLQFEENSFNGIWCHTSLIHLDSKERITNVLKNFAKLLKSSSPLFVALREGQGERWELYYNIPNTERWFLYFEAGEFEKYIPLIFTIEQVKTTEYKNHRFLNYHLLLKH